MLDYFSLQGKTALVTGASRGLGKAAAFALAESGANVIILGREQNTLNNAAKELDKYGTRVIPIAMNVSDSSQYPKLKEKILQEFGKLDILVNNAGIVIDKPYLETTDEEIDKLLQTNLYAVMKLTRELGELMVKQNGGKIINIGSYDGLVGTPNLVAYGTSKGGVIQFTRILAVEWARYQINVNVICPGYFATSMNDMFFQNEEITRKVLKRIPLRRVGQPEEIGPLIVYLASKASDYMTGQVLIIDGGETAR